MKARLTASCLHIASTVVLAATPALSPAQQIAAALSPAPPEARDTATVLGHSADGGVQPLRQGTGDLICLGKFYIGSKVTPLGSLFGLPWAFADGAIGGAIFAWLYNLLAPKQKNH